MKPAFLWFRISQVSTSTKDRSRSLMRPWMICKLAYHLQHFYTRLLPSILDMLQIQGLPRPPTGAISCPSPPLLAGTMRGKVLRTWGLQRPPGGFSHPSLSLGVHRGAGRIMRKDYVQRCVQGWPAVQHRWLHVAI